MGDFNAKVGKEAYQNQVAGMHTIHDSSNENGRMLGQFASRNNLLIRSTVYPHKHIHLGTWKIPGTNEEINQIVHVLVSKRHSSRVKDVRSCRWPNHDSDHYLVKVQVKEKLATYRKWQK
jgi:endonuclease/exonuclease/phosphatase family metal-dependent hydrolase